MPRYPNKVKLTAAILSGTFMVAGLSACGRSTQSTEQLLTEARQYQQRGDLKSAMIQLKNAVEKSPENGEARMELGNLELDMGDFPSAEKEFRKARANGIAAARVLPQLGKALAQQGKHKELLDDIGQDTAIHSAPLLVLRGDALLATGRNDEAKQAYEQALALHPNFSDALLGLSRHALVTQNFEAAERYVNDAVANNPKDAEAHMARGTLLRAFGKTNEAIAAFDQVQVLNPHHRTVHIEKAYIDISQGKFPEAKAEIDAAEKNAPGGLLITYTRGLYEFSQGKYAAAQEELQKVLKAIPEHMPSLLLIGACEINLGSTQQAEQHLRRYLEVDPNNVYARKLLAQTLLKNSYPADAVTVVAPALKEAENDPQLLALAGESYMQVRDFNKASVYLEKAATLSPKVAGLHTSLGLAKLAQGDQARGLSELESATSLDPKSLPAMMALVKAEISLKHYDKALAAIDAFEKQQSVNAQTCNLKGAVYLLMGDTTNARSNFEKAVALQPNFFTAVSNLARLDLQQNNPVQAKQRFEKMLEKDNKNYGAMAAIGEINLLENHVDEATSWFEKASAANPDAIAPALKLGEHYLRIKQPQKALKLAQKFLTTNATNADLFELLGQAQLATKDVSGALDTYSKLVKLSPKSAAAQLRLAQVHMLMSNNNAAADDLKRAIELQPEFMPARLAQVELAVRTGRASDALALAQQIQKMNSKSSLGYAIEGDVLMVQGKPALALPAYEKALAIAKTPELMIKTLRTMNLLGKTNEVQARAAQWQKEHADDVLVPLFLAEGKLAQNEVKPAVVMLEDIVKRRPDNVTALNNLAWAYQQQNDPRALPTAEQAYKLAGENPSILDTLGWLLIEQGNTARGLSLLQKAAGLAPDAAEIRYHLAVGLNKSGDKQGARKELNKLLSDNKSFHSENEARALLKTL